MITPVLLAALALVLTGPAPALLARSSWPYRIPRAAVALWQSIALAAVLAALGAGIALSYSTAGEPGQPRFDPSSARDLLAAAVLALTALVGVKLGEYGSGRLCRIPRRREGLELVERKGAVGIGIELGEDVGGSWRRRGRVTGIGIVVVLRTLSKQAPPTLCYLQPGFAVEIVFCGAGLPLCLFRHASILIVAVHYEPSGSPRFVPRRLWNSKLFDGDLGNLSGVGNAGRTPHVNTAGCHGRITICALRDRRSVHGIVVRTTALHSKWVG